MWTELHYHSHSWGWQLCEPDQCAHHCHHRYCTFIEFVIKWYRNKSHHSHEKSRHHVLSLTLSPPTLPGPCPYRDLRATQNCGSNSAQISWMPGNGTLNYNASAEISFFEEHMVSCSTSGSSCSITNLQCGSSYQISVTGQGLTCPIQSDEWITLKTGNSLSWDTKYSVRKKI